MTLETPKPAEAPPQSEEARYLKQIADDMHFIRQVLVWIIVINGVLLVAQICSIMWNTL